MQAIERQFAPCLFLQTLVQMLTLFLTISSANQVSSPAEIAANRVLQLIQDEAVWNSRSLYPTQGEQANSLAIVSPVVLTGRQQTITRRPLSSALSYQQIKPLATINKREKRAAK